MTRHARQLAIVEVNRKIKIRRVVKHSVKVTAGAGMWFVSTFIAHDPVIMVVLLVVSVIAQTVAEEFIDD